MGDLDAADRALPEAEADALGPGAAAELATNLAEARHSRGRTPPPARARQPECREWYEPTREDLMTLLSSDIVVATSTTAEGRDATEA